MANSTDEATASYALTDLLPALQRVTATGSFVWRAASDEIMASEQVYDIFDLDRARPLTLDLLDTRVHPDDLALFHEKIEQARTVPGDVDFEVRLRIPDGAVKHLHVVAHGIRDPAGHLEYIGAAHDVTSGRLSALALGEARAALTHMARLTTLGILAPSFAHDASQSLAGIMINASTCLRTLARDPPGLEGARAAARRALRDVERARDILRRLCTLAAKKNADTESLDLNSVTREALDLLSSELQKHRVILRTEFAGDLPHVKGDRVQLRQVVLSLLANSSEAMSDIEDRPRHLLIKTELHEDEHVRVTVRDTRVSNPEDRQRPLGGSSTIGNEDIGMGWLVSRSIIERHHGRLWAAPNEGSGAAFSFYIPAEARM